MLNEYGNPEGKWNDILEEAEYEAVEAVKRVVSKYEITLPERRMIYRFLPGHMDGRLTAEMLRAQSKKREESGIRSMLKKGGD